MKRVGKPALYTIIYYAVAIAIITGIEASGKFKSGPCTPDLDLLVPMLFFLISCILLWWQLCWPSDCEATIG